MLFVSTESISKIKLNKWAEFVLKQKNANIFQTLQMYEIYKNTLNYKPIFFSVTNERNEILGVLLSVVQKEHKGILGKFSSRSIIWGGPLIKNNNLEVLDFILKEYSKTIRNKAIYTQFRNIWEWNEQEKEIFAKNGFKFKKHLDIIHDLTIHPDKQFMKMNQGRRKNIRRSIKQEVGFEEIKTKTELLESLSLIKETYKKVKLPLPDESLFISVFNQLFHQKLVRFFKATYQEKLIAVRFVFCYKDLIYDWFAGSSEDHLNKYPNDFLPWKVMEWGHHNGYKKFDFGGAGKPNEKYGVRDYKLKFGGELVEFGRFEQVHKPILMHIGKKGLKIYKLIKHVR